VRQSVQYKVIHEESEQNEVDGMKEEADSTGKVWVWHIENNGWRFVTRKIQMVKQG